MYKITVFNDENKVLLKEEWHGICIECVETLVGDMVKKLTEYNSKSSLEYSVKYFA